MVVGEEEGWDGRGGGRGAILSWWQVTCVYISVCVSVVVVEGEGEEECIHVM